MSKYLLQTALDFFPSPAQLYSKHLDMQTCIDMLRTYLLSVGIKHRLSIYQTAREQIETTDFCDVDCLPLWFFSHPSFLVFEGFIADAKVCRAFADYLQDNLSSRRKSKSRRASRRVLKRAVARTESRYLATRYETVLDRSIDDRFSYCYQVNNQVWDIALIPPDAEPKIPEHDIPRFCQEIEEKITRDALWTLKREIESSRDDEYSRILDLDRPNPVDISFAPDDIVTELHLSNFVPDIPKTWRRVVISNLIVQAIRRGTWIRFTLDQTPRTTKIRTASLHHYQLNDDLLRQVRALYTKDGLSDHFRAVKYGRLPIGLKIHCAETRAPGYSFLQRGYFRAHNAGTCFNLPPVGNIEAVQELLAAIQDRAGVQYLNNPNFQVQVCSPGKLTARNAAILGICFYLGSDQVRRYVREDFVTSHRWSTGDRLIIYGAGQMDEQFAWWGKEENGRLTVTTLTGVLADRTDVLTCQSMKDIENVNLIATLLVHTEHAGFFDELGKQFITDVEELLRRHQLSGLLQAAWVKEGYSSSSEEDELFFNALEELTTYAHDEVVRIQRGDTTSRCGILFEMQALLDWYQAEIVAQAFLEGGEINHEH